MAELLTYEQVLELLPAYALGVLEPAEMLAVDDYLRRQRSLLRRLEAIEQALPQLAYLAQETPTAAETPPIVLLPAEAKAQLMARARADAAAQQAGQTRAESAPAPAGLASARSIPKPIAEAPISQGWLAGFWAALRGNGWAVATGGVMILLLVVGFYALQFKRSNDGLQAEVASLHADKSALEAGIVELQTEQEALQTQVGLLQTENQALQTEIAQILKDSETLQAQIRQLNADYETLLAEKTGLQADYEALQRVADQLQLAQNRLNFVANAPHVVVALGTDQAPGASATFYASPDNEGLLVLRDLPPLSESETYQLWLIPPGQAPVSAGLVNIESEQPVWIETPIPGEAQDFVNVGLTREPAGGSEAPSLDALVLFSNET